MRTDTVTVAAAHAAPVFLDRPGTVAKAAALVEDAADRGVRFLAFPEAFVPGFPYWINLTPILHQGGMFRRLWEQAVDVHDAEHLGPVVAAAARGVCVVLGVNERAGGTLYNAQVVIDGERGVIGVRRKLVPTLAERTVWGYGDGSTLHTYDTSAGRVSALMCWEHAMNLARQALIVEGAQLHAAAWPALETVTGLEGYDDRVALLVRHHAFTGQCFVVSPMSPLTPEVVEAVGHLPGASALIRPGPAWSAIVAPSGRVVAEEHGSEDTLLVAEVDLGETVEAKFALDAGGHSARAEILSMRVDRTPYQGPDRD